MKPSRRVSLISFAVALGVTIGSPYGFAAEIHVRLVNTLTGKPMNDQPIVLYLGRDDKAVLHQTTDEDGVAVFHMPTPIPDWINPAEASYTLYHCSPYQKTRFPIAEVLQRGVVALNTCDPKGKLKGKVQAMPGEVVVFARPLHWWEKGQW
jgi:hypothetical protein